MGTKPCKRCGEVISYIRGSKKYCEPCRKKVRVEDTQRWVQKKEDESLGEIDPKYLRR